MVTSKAILMKFHPTKYWTALKDGRVQCDICPRFCKIQEGKRGMCFVRGVDQGEIKLLTYGHSSGFCIDPIEKKPLNHFYPGTPVLSFGTAGCNLACQFCQNWSISKSRQFDTLADQASPEKIAQAASQSGCHSVAFTYNDPIIFMEYAIDVAMACKEKGLKTVAVTAGYINDEPREEFFRVMDAVNVDLKAFSESFYRKITHSSLQPILETIQYLKKQTDVWLELTTLLIPDENDSISELDTMSSWVSTHLGKDVPHHFSAFHPDWKMKNKMRTPFETLSKARKIAMGYGLNYVYTGNVTDLEGATTICPACKKRLIVRDRYALVEYKVDATGSCDYCAAPLAGRFQKQPGNWGMRRQPVKI